MGVSDCHARCSSEAERGMCRERHSRELLWPTIRHPPQPDHAASGSHGRSRPGVEPLVPGHAPAEEAAMSRPTPLGRAMAWQRGPAPHHHEPGGEDATVPSPVAVAGRTPGAARRDRPRTRGRQLDDARPQHGRARLMYRQPFRPDGPLGLRPSEKPRGWGPTTCPTLSGPPWVRRPVGPERSMRKVTRQDCWPTPSPGRTRPPRRESGGGGAGPYRPATPLCCQRQESAHMSSSVKWVVKPSSAAAREGSA